MGTNLNQQAEERAKSKPAPTDPNIRDFLKTAFDRWQFADEAESQTRDDMLDDWRFVMGEQWPADIKTQRVTDSRPCLTMNRFRQFVRIVTNAQRAQRPAIQVNPVGDASDPDTAEALQGVIRNIEVNSHADIAYDTASDFQVICGRAFVRVLTEYSDDKSFNQDIKISAVRNPFTVYFDPSAVEPDYSDAGWCFIVEDLSREQFLERYPDSCLKSLNEFSGTGSEPPGWLSKEGIRIAEYFYIDYERGKLHKLASGESASDEEYKALPEIEGVPKPEIVDTREVLKKTVKWAKFNAVEILDGNDELTEGKPIAGKFIPVVPFLGDTYDVNGKKIIAGLIRDAKDPQRMYNYWVSAATEKMALAPKAPFIIAEGQIENHEEEWKQANVRNFAVLSYKPVSVSGQPVPPPQRQLIDPQLQSVSTMIAQSDNDIKATMGIYDASLGQQGPEQSGKAILARQKQGALATINFSDNVNRGIRRIGEIVLDLIPKIYDVPRIMRIIKPDESVSQIAVFNSQATQMQAQDAQQTLNNPAIKKIYDVGVGKYDVTISAGPSYQTKRMEAVESMTALVQAYPNLMGLVGDLLVRQMDWPFAVQIADRLKAMLPANVQSLDSTDDPKAKLMQMQQQFQTVMQQHEALVKQLNDATETINTKKLELDSKERIVDLQERTKILVAEIDAKFQEGKTRMEMEREQWLALHGSAHERALSSMEHQQDLEVQQAGNNGQGEV